MRWPEITLFKMGIGGLEVVGLLFIVMVAYVLIWSHFSQKSPIVLSDLLMEEVRGRFRLTLTKFAGFMGFFVGTWAFLYSLLNDTLSRDWGGIAAYMGISLTATGYGMYKHSQDNANVSMPPDAGNRGISP